MNKVKLKEICRLINGRAYKQHELLDSGKYPVLRVGNFFSDKEFYYSDMELDEDKYCDNGDLLFAWSASFGPKIWNGGKVIYHYHIWKMELTEKVDKNYLYYYLYHLSERIKSEGHGGIMIHTTKAEMEEREFVLPELLEQREIAKILAKVASVIEMRKQELEKLDELIKARFVELFGDPMTNPHNIPKVILGSVLTVEPQNGLYKPQSDYVSDGTGVPILRIDSFYDGKVTGLSSLKRLICSETELKRYLLYENDIVINRVNSIEYLGKCGLIQDLVENTVFESNMMRLHIDENKFHPVYITKLLCSEFIYQQILRRAKKAVNQASINQKDVESFVVYMPPIDQQNQFATFVEQTNKSKVAVQKALDETQVLFDSLMQEYFG